MCNPNAKLITSVSVRVRTEIMSQPERARCINGHRFQSGVDACVDYNSTPDQ